MGKYFSGLSGASALAETSTIRAAASGKPVYTVDQIADYLIDGLWPRSSFNVTTGGTLTVRLSGLTAEGQQLARWALDAWSDVLGITFEEVASGPADIIFDDVDPSGAYSTSNTTGETINFSYVNVPVNWLNAYGTSIDSYSFQTYIHEIGHALGLGHAGDYNGTANFWTDAVYENDSNQMSVMSYFSQTDNPFVDASFASIVTPMIADMVAVAELYGTTTTANLGDTVYGANSNVGGYMGELFGILYDGNSSESDFYDGGPVAFTILDSGGIDTLDFSTVSAGQNLNLNAEAISDVGGLVGNLVIGRGTVIENGYTGAGNDVLTGNDVDNILSSGAGKDRVIGAGGDDDLDGGNGNDLLGGGAGEDTVAGGNGTDFLFGGDDADGLNGGAGLDFLIGGEGADRLDGGGGNDMMIGGAGADIFVFTSFVSGEADSIRDFEDGLDLIELAGVAGFSALTISDASTAQITATVVEVNGLSITLQGVEVADLSADDFVFV
ncbi:M10 family metallopeptidase [Actibacterium lipolyticum]|uniref:Serralysin n=1 Tax=Actibacterium lipolyticum TaxID=1524263 RepID=A0A238KUN2_9RHOB|nr:M10 family metallopeptidase [Actibacterium lipolyticum]SMX46417.1 Serralysin precursor [Actibacterium lipolyticum]